MELLHSLVPTAGVIGFLVNPRDPNAETDVKDAQAAAGLLGLKLVVGAASAVGNSNGITIISSGHLSGRSGSGTFKQSDGCVGRWTASKQ